VPTLTPCYMTGTAPRWRTPHQKRMNMHDLIETVRGMTYEIHPDLLFLIVMLGVFMLWQVMRVAKAQRTRTPIQEEFITQGQRQSELLARQIEALERIAAALEKQ